MRQTVRLYYRLTKPGIVYSNTMTAAAGFLLASGRHVNFGVMVSLLAGTALIIASACVFNNYLDRGIDSKMDRTKGRGLASGAISGRHGLLYGIILGLAGFAALAGTNILTFIIGWTAIFSYVVVYGLAKRKSEHGTLVGTVPGAASLVAGYTAVYDRLGMEALVLFLIMVTWQMPHFYAIAINRYKDYKAAGLPVLPVKRGVRTARHQIIFYLVLFAVSVSLLTMLGYTGAAYLVVMLPVSLYWLFLAIKKTKTPDERRWARQVFGFSLLTLLVLCVMLSLNPWLP